MSSPIINNRFEIIILQKPEYAITLYDIVIYMNTARN